MKRKIATLVVLTLPPTMPLSSICAGDDAENQPIVEDIHGLEPTNNQKPSLSDNKALPNDDEDICPRQPLKEKKEVCIDSGCMQKVCLLCVISAVASCYRGTYRYIFAEEEN